MRIEYVVAAGVLSAAMACAPAEFTDADQAAVVESVKVFSAEYVAAVNSPDGPDLIQFRSGEFI